MARRILGLVGIGLLGGFLSGLFGVGGGILMVPLLVTLFKVDQRNASALSLAAIVPAAMVGSITYGVAGHVDVIASALIAIGGIAGAIIGVKLLRRLPLVVLRWGFVGLLLAVAVRMLFDVPVRNDQLDLTVLSVLGMIGLGLVVGIASGLFGIGGGVIIVPSLIAVFGVSELIAKGTSLLAIVPTSLAGTIANSKAKLVNPLDGLTLGAAAALAAFPGVLVARELPDRISNILFAALLVVAAIQLATKGWRARKG